MTKNIASLKNLALEHTYSVVVPDKSSFQKWNVTCGTIFMSYLSHNCLKIAGMTNSTGPSYVWKWTLTSALWKWPQKWKISSTSPLWKLRTEPVAWLVFVSTSCMIKCGTMVEGSLLANRLTSLLGKGPSIKDVSSRGRGERASKEDLMQ